jgi:hypothetical protein
MTWIRVSDGFVNSDHVIRIVEDVRGGKDVSVLHLIDGTTATAKVYSCDIVEQLCGQKLPVPHDDTGDDDVPF